MAISIRGGSPGTTFTTANPTSLTLNGARQPNAGDLVVAIHFNDFYGLAAMPTPTFNGSTTGVTSITGTGLPADGGTNFGHIKAWWWAAGSTADVTISATESAPGDEDKGIIGYVLSGADTTTPIDAAAGNFESSSATANQVAPSVSPATSDAFLICHTNNGGGGNTGPITSFPAGMTSQYDVNGGGMRFAGATQQLVSSGATGTKAFVATGSGFWVTCSIAIKTAAAGGSVIVPQIVVAPPAALVRASTW